jgi:hypothetical protein
MFNDSQEVAQWRGKERRAEKEKDVTEKKKMTICDECKHVNRNGSSNSWYCKVNPKIDPVCGNKSGWYCHEKNVGNCKDFAREPKKK